MDVLESFHANPYDGSSHSLNLAVMFLDNCRVFPALTDNLRKILKGKQNVFVNDCFSVFPKNKTPQMTF